ncbi:MAG: hypothetical protein ABSA30_00220 [Candidatus Aminicenantales bacterium]|jgi:hypothetical protein
MALNRFERIERAARKADARIRKLELGLQAAGRRLKVLAGRRAKKRAG